MLWFNIIIFLYFILITIITIIVCSFRNNMHVNSHKAHAHMDGRNVMYTVLSQTED